MADDNGKSQKVRSSPSSTLPHNSISSIRNGARVINDKLLAKGYFSTRPEKLKRLLFLSLDKEELQKSDDITAENDRNVINIIFSLLDSLEVSSLYKESSLKAMADKDGQSGSLHAQISRLERQMTLKTKEIQSLHRENLRGKLDLESAQAKVTNLTNKNRDWERNFQVYSSEVDRELRRNEIEIDQLSTRLSRNQQRLKRRIPDEVVDVKRPRLDNNDGLISLIDENNRLRAQGNAYLCFCHKLYAFLKRYNESTLGLGRDQPEIPYSFVPTEEEILYFDPEKFDMMRMSQMFVGLLKQVDLERNEDTFKFRKVTKEQPVVKENEELREKLRVSQETNERLLRSVEEWRKWGQGHIKGPSVVSTDQASERSKEASENDGVSSEAVIKAADKVSDGAVNQEVVTKDAADTSSHEVEEARTPERGQQATEL